MCIMKSLVCLMIIACASVSNAGQYQLSTNVSVTQVTDTNVEIPVTSVDVESILVVLMGPEPKFVIRLAMKSASGVVVCRKSATVSNAQMKALMPTIDEIMSGGRSAMSNNINTLVSIAK